MLFALRKLCQPRVLKRVFLERLTEPIHLNCIAVMVFLFGSLRSKVLYDLVIRPYHAYCILKCADEAKRLGVGTVSLIEFGVASGAGLMYIIEIAGRVSKETGVAFRIYGFDTGRGMPPAQDYRDHPELYQEGDFPMNSETLKGHLPQNAELILGEIRESVEGFLDRLSVEAPIGFVSLDVDYYHSATDALRIFQDADPRKYLPLTLVYLDDITLEPHNSNCGEYLAVAEHNREFEMRPIEHHRFLENSRIFRRPIWLKQVYFMHSLDHPTRQTVVTSSKKRTMFNPYLNYQGNAENFEA
jgi:hypothetical protein